ncbi:hypothetical protein QAD02_001901 [Eretmocerus hayati]|uniref:Uncharacterized protein n=1 Tax=Eretmocerus hayati TaxID=131215 RepID=A0ACC2NHQ8_9HYME|nr:hypothetical protein QAD02_001901 [Eretmocerus hayati]
MKSSESSNRECSLTLQMEGHRCVWNRVLASELRRASARKAEYRIKQQLIVIRGVLRQPTLTTAEEKCKMDTSGEEIDVVGEIDNNLTGSTSYSPPASRLGEPGPVGEGRYKEADADTERWLGVIDAEARKALEAIQAAGDAELERLTQSFSEVATGGKIQGPNAAKLQDRTSYQRALYQPPKLNGPQQLNENRQVRNAQPRQLGEPSKMTQQETSRLHFDEDEKPLDLSGRLPRMKSRNQPHIMTRNVLREYLLKNPTRQPHQTKTVAATMTSRSPRAIPNISNAPLVAPRQGAGEVNIIRGPPLPYYSPAPGVLMGLKPWRQLAAPANKEQRRVFEAIREKSFTTENCVTSDSERIKHRIGYIWIAPDGLAWFCDDYLLPAGPVKYAAKFATPELANQFVSEKLKTINENWHAFIPDASIYKIGIIYNIGERISSQDILDGLDEDVRKKVLKVQRIYSKVRTPNGIVDHPTDKFKIFAKNELPESIRLFGSIYRNVEYFIPAVLRCFNCQRYGHSAATCRKEFKCVNCGENHYTERCSRSPVCINCKDKHPASDHGCVHFKFNKEINLLMTQRRICRAEPISLVQSNYRTRFEHSSGHKLSEVYVDPSNPYISRRDIFEHKNIFTVLAKDWPQLDEEQFVMDTHQGIDMTQMYIIDHTEEIITSHAEDSWVITPEIISPSNTSANSSSMTLEVDVDPLQKIRDSHAFESMTKSAQKEMFRAQLKQSRKIRKEEKPYETPKHHKKLRENGPSEAEK